MPNQTPTSRLGRYLRRPSQGEQTEAQPDAQPDVATRARPRISSPILIATTSPYQPENMPISPPLSTRPLSTSPPLGSPPQGMFDSLRRQLAIRRRGQRSDSSSSQPPSLPPLQPAFEPRLRGSQNQPLVASSNANQFTGPRRQVPLPTTSEQNSPPPAPVQHQSTRSRQAEEPRQQPEPRRPQPVSDHSRSASGSSRQRGMTRHSGPHVDPPPLPSKERRPVAACLQPGGSSRDPTGRGTTSVFQPLESIGQPSRYVPKRQSTTTSLVPGSLPSQGPSPDPSHGPSQGPSHGVSQGPRHGSNQGFSRATTRGDDKSDDDVTIIEDSEAESEQRPVDRGVHVARTMSVNVGRGIPVDVNEERGAYRPPSSGSITKSDLAAAISASQSLDFAASAAAQAAAADARPARRPPPPPPQQQQRSQQPQYPSRPGPEGRLVPAPVSSFAPRQNQRERPRGSAPRRRYSSSSPSPYCSASDSPSPPCAAEHPQGGARR